MTYGEVFGTLGQIDCHTLPILGIRAPCSDEREATHLLVGRGSQHLEFLSPILVVEFADIQFDGLRHTRQFGRDEPVVGSLDGPLRLRDTGRYKILVAAMSRIIIGERTIGRGIIGGIEHNP